MNLSISITLIVVLLVANAFFVAAEFALVKARGFRIETLAQEGSLSARLTLRILKNLEAYLAACQLGITMASLGLGWVGEPAIAALLEPMFTQLGVSEAMVHTSSFIIGFLLFSSLHIVVGEQVPKTFAIRQPEPVSLWCAYPLHAVYLAVWPLNWVLNWTTGRILAMFGIAEATHAEIYSSEEIKGLVAASSQHGEITVERADMLRNLFEFDQRDVGRVMLPYNAIHTLDITSAPEDIVATILETEHSRFPVIDSSRDDQIIGVLLAKDLQRALLTGEREPWRNLATMAREALVVPESQTVSRLFELMRQRRAHMALVVDEYGTFLGIVTLEDLLEEIVGEIQDETDTEDENQGIESIGENHWKTSGMISLNDLERHTGLSVPIALDANTLSGLFMERHGRMPEAGDELEENGYLLQITSLDGRRADTVIVKQMPEPTPQSDDEADRH